MRTNDPVFVDTSGWIAVLNADDQLHAQATKLLREFGLTRRPLITTDWIFAETGNGLARTALRPQFVQAVRTFLQSTTGRTVRIDQQFFTAALELYSQAADKTWGFVDCASFVVMRNEGILEALTADRHFQQAGFRCLLPTS
jgi:predicted nucleic acid-binding protein